MGARRDEEANVAIRADEHPHVVVSPEGPLLAEVAPKRARPHALDVDGNPALAKMDGYYAIAFSAATDALMDALGLDAAYRAATRCTWWATATRGFISSRRWSASTARSPRR